MAKSLDLKLHPRSAGVEAETLFVCELLANAKAQRSAGQLSCSRTSYSLMHPGSAGAPCFMVWLLVPARWGGVGLRLGATTVRTMGWHSWRWNTQPHQG